ncbi:hypothetical protein PHLCEN_2v12735 [Hermanssonia centrifuga]|uniref:Uncharacterized protein n=1 Tax=Hermanssonia centrifuga TaxID=98765 RepID=A0A2R6NGU5_9APHY|nr:hypothetical protein PHLCEN_2v12735 [Hermanssonia centrifuga]
MTRDNTYTKANGVFKQDILPVTHEQPTRLQEPVNNNKPKLVWNWELEHADRKKEAKADSAIHGTPPFQVDRKLLKDIVNEKMGTEVARINYLGAVDGREVVARVARRFMPRLKTESEVATMRYLRERTNIPVPIVYHYDANPYNRLGGEYILMSKAQGVPLSRVFHSMAHPELMGLMQNLALMLLPLFALRFPRIGSLYLGPDSEPIADSSTAATPTAMSRTLSMTPVKHQYALVPQSEFHVGPIVSWPFFGSNRGDLVHPTEINRGPWSSTHSYLQSCVDREVKGVMLENEGKTAPHRLHLDPDEIISSRHHKVQALSGDVSDQSDEWDWEESEAEWDGPGNRMYEDYRRMQRTTFLVAHLRQREEKVKEEMNRFVKIVERLGTALREQGDGGGSGTEEFTLDCHDLNLENVFVDEHDPSQITCIIDWESTTTRPLWAAAHVPAFLQTSPFTSKLFRATIEKISKQPRSVMVGGQIRDLSLIATEWLHHEASGTRLRMAHRCVEWDGWEEGLVTSILGPEEQEEDWFKSWDDANPTDSAPDYPDTPQSPSASTSPTLTESVSDGEDNAKRLSGGVVSKTKNRTANQLPLKVVAVEKEKEKLLNSTGDYCGGRGGELGRRLEAWLCVNGDSEGRVELAKKWDGHVEEGL